ncbi:hypothetical protein BGZ54_002296, partial [Gamsiella multidivaricata]
SPVSPVVTEPILQTLLGRHWRVCQTLDGLEEMVLSSHMSEREEQYHWQLYQSAVSQEASLRAEVRMASHGPERVLKRLQEILDGLYGTNR